MDLRCPKCNSTDLKKVSLAYQEGLFQGEARTRLRAVVVGGAGPDVVVGRTTTRGSQQSALSKNLTPPVKWSYLKVIGWSVLVFVCVGWLVFYVNTVTTNATTVSSLLLRDDFVVACHHRECAKLQPFGKVHRGNRGFTMRRLNLVVEDLERKLSGLYGQPRSVQFGSRPNEDCDFMSQ